LTKDEYVGLAASLFKTADKDGDGTIDAKELHSTAGIELDRVIE
jgi:Ca2+-binding EF-hand superfamily protein